MCSFPGNPRPCVRGALSWQGRLHTGVCTQAYQAVAVHVHLDHLRALSALGAQLRAERRNQRQRACKRQYALAEEKGRRERPSLFPSLTSRPQPQTATDTDTQTHMQTWVTKFAAWVTADETLVGA